MPHLLGFVSSVHVAQSVHPVLFDVVLRNLVKAYELCIHSVFIFCLNV